MSRLHRILAACIAAMVSLTAASFAQAAFHLFQVGEVYSNASGSVQFVELFTDQSSQQFLTNANFSGGFTSTSHTFMFPGNLPSDSANKHFIIGTPGYAALTGVPTADYTFATNNFFSTTADTLTLHGGQFPTLTYTSGQLPFNGLNSLNRAYNGAFVAPPTTFTTTLNTPTNFAGTPGTIVPTGDINLDGHINAADIPDMMSALSDLPGFGSAKGISAQIATKLGDVNNDTKFNGADLQALVNKLKNGQGTSNPVPEPATFILAVLTGAVLWKSSRRFAFG